MSFIGKRYVESYNPILLVFLILFFGCREEETSIPEILFYSPVHNEEFNESDSIYVHALISDERPIQYIRTNLTDENLISVSPHQTNNPGVYRYELKTYISLSDIDFESGTFYVLIRAENDSEFKNKYQKIFLHAEDRVFERPVVITSPSSTTIEISGVENYDSIYQITSFTGSFAGAEISSKDKLLFIAGKTGLNLTAFDLKENQIAWQLDQVPGTPIHNDHCLYFDELLYTTFNFDYIFGYTTNGDIEFNVTLEESDAPGRIIKNGSYVLADIKQKNISTPFIATYYTVTGSEKQRRLISFDVVNFHPYDDENVIIVANLNGEGKLYKYNLNEDILSELKTVDELLTASVQVDVERVILATNSKLYEFSATGGELTVVLNSGASGLYFEEISKKLLITNGLEAEVYEYPQMENQKTLLFSDSILCILFEYSK